MILFYPGTFALAYKAEDLLRKAGGAASKFARGNLHSAVQQTLPSASIPLNQGPTLYVNAGGVGVNQRVDPLDKFGNKYFHTSASYGAQVSPSGNRPRVSQGVNVQTGTKYVSNNTRFGTDW